VINYLNQFYFGFNNNDINNDTLELISYFGKIFHYKNALIYHKYNSFNILYKDNIYSHFYLFNNSLYDYLKFKKQYLSFNPFISYEIGYWFLDEYFNKKTESNIINNVKTNKDLFINTCDNKFEYYFKMCSLLNSNIINKPYVIFNIYDKLQSTGENINFKPNIEYTEDNVLDQDFKLIFRQPIRRY
jgi:hypothetical protein